MDKPYECITSFQNGIEVGKREELARCKDCKWRFDLHCPMFDGETDHVPDLNWFCADGEPRRDIR